MQHEPYAWLDARRLAPRIDVATFCSELVSGGREQPGLVIDLSAEGARLERPYLGGPSSREVLLELEVPAIDEVIWARAEVCFDQLRQAPPGQGGPLGLLRTTGLRLIRAASRDLRMLADCVFELHRARHRDEPCEPPANASRWRGAAPCHHSWELLDASCYARG